MQHSGKCEITLMISPVLPQRACNYLLAKPALGKRDTQSLVCSAETSSELTLIAEK